MIRSGRGALAKMPCAVQEAEGLVAVADQAHAATDMPSVEDLHRRTGVAEIIFDQQDFHRPADNRAAEKALSHGVLNGLSLRTWYTLAGPVPNTPKQEPRWSGVLAVKGESSCPNNTHP